MHHLVCTTKDFVHERHVFQVSEFIANAIVVDDVARLQGSPDANQFCVSRPFLGQLFEQPASEKTSSSCNHNFHQKSYVNWSGARPLLYSSLKCECMAGRMRFLVLYVKLCLAATSIKILVMAG